MKNENQIDNLYQTLEEMVENLGLVISNSLDICAPLKTFKVREAHKFGLTETTKKLMKERDKARSEIKVCLTLSEKAVQHTKYIFPGNPKCSNSI